MEAYSAQELPIVQAFLSEHEANQQALKKLLRETAQMPDETFEQQLWINYQLLQVWDRLSLSFCLHDLTTAPELRLGSIPTDYTGQATNLHIIPQGDNSVTISPYPFAFSPLAFTLIVRDIPDCKYADDSHLQEALHAALPREFHFQAQSEEMENRVVAFARMIW